MTLTTITLARPLVLPQSADCDCCAGHLLEALRARSGVAAAQLDGAQIVLQVDAEVVPAGAAEQLAREAGLRITQRYDHPVFAVEGMDCADCARTFEHALARLTGVHYAIVNFAAARLRLEYDRELTSVDAIVGLARSLGYALRPPQALGTLACSVDGMCCAVEAGVLEQALRRMPGVQQVAADPALARLSVGYDPRLLAADQIVAQVEQLGFRVAQADTPAHPHATPGRTTRRAWPGEFVRSHPKNALTIVCGALIVAAWLAGLLGAPAAVATSLYVLATLTGGALVARSGWAVLRATHTLDINLLMTIAATGALLIGEYAEGAAVVFLFALGNALEGYTMDRARRSIRALMQLAPETARVLKPRAATSGQTEHPAGSDAMADRLAAPSAPEYDEVETPIAQVAVGAVIVIRPGERVPLDAQVLAGTSAVNQAPITGESMPAEKAAGAELYAGSINGEGALEARVTRPANDSTLARIIDLVETAQAQKSRTQRLIDRFATAYTPAVIGLALLVALLPPLLAGGAWALWFYRALVLLVIACPCALVISTPVSIVSAISAAARAGVLFKGGAALEAAGGLRAIAFDKTGTLTSGRPLVTDVIVPGEPAPAGAAAISRRADQPGQADDPSLSRNLPGALTSQQERVLQVAAAVERQSTHPLARAIVAAAEAYGLAIPAAAEARMAGGRGVLALIDGRPALVGNRALFEGQPIPAGLDANYAELEQAGRTAMLVSYDGAFLGVLAVADQPRPESRATVAALRQLGLAHVAVLTGDAAPVAAQVGAAVAADEVRAGLLPEQKLVAIGELLGRYGSVAMVGDGINDAPALARATVGIAMGAAGSDAALETADVALMADDLGKLPFAIGLSRAARRLIIQNIVFALVVKAAFMVATLLGAATLWMAVFADTGAALIVIANGMRLLRYQPGR